MMFTVVMGNQDLSVMCMILKIINIFDKDSVPDVVPLGAGENSSDDEGNESVLEEGDSSNKTIPLHYALLTRAR